MLLLGFTRLLIVGSGVLAGTISEGGKCLPGHDHYDPNTHKFISQCSDLTFCSTSPSASTNSIASETNFTNVESGICTPRLCRRDQFPFGYGPTDALPPLCLHGEFCPDEGNGCKGVLQPGSACQFGRDEQCVRASPADPGTGAWTAERIFRADQGPDDEEEVLCLLNVCTVANVSLAQPCISENTTYTDFAFDGSLIDYSIYRDNCLPQFFCAPGTLQCEEKKVLGGGCQYDIECSSFNCLQGVCVHSPETPYHVAPWQYAVTVLCIAGSMSVTFIMLMALHKRHRKRRYLEVREYYSEQARLRRAIISLHEAAADALY
ncbi:hypothetical protein ONZ45_g13379 [Pleurotus djamor]|nr:hypothetical protein ONZ45_g13379 [Pleurotus djamor]